MPMVPTNNHPLFDGTQTSLGPLKLGTTYLGIALVWVVGCFAIATIEVPPPSFLSILWLSIEIVLELLPRVSPRGEHRTLTISSPEHRTISLCASTESQATKPSRRRQPPRVTSTTGLQHEHLVPLDAISQCNALESLTHTIGWSLSSICELEALLALPSMDTKSQGCSAPAKAGHHFYL